MSKNEVEKQLAVEKLDKQLSEITESVDYYELYGYDLRSLAASASGTKIRENLLSKFLIANKYDLEAAKAQLKKTLSWRKEFNPLSAAFKETHDPQLDQLGVITSHNGTIATWNLYGAVKNREKLFSKLDEFTRWRVGLMEKGIALLDFASDDQKQNGYMIQTHDYFDVSMLRLDASTKAASSKTIQLFQDYYPEFVSRKFFVNVPLLMAWMFSFAKTFMSAETASKLTMISNGKDLAAEIGSWVPKKYGGKTDSLETLRVKEFPEPSIYKAKAEVEQTAPEPVASEQPVAAESVVGESTTTEPVIVGESATTKPVAAESTTAEPTAASAKAASTTEQLETSNA